MYYAFSHTSSIFCRARRRLDATATVWCVPFFGIGTVGLFNKLQTQKKPKSKKVRIQKERTLELERCAPRAWTLVRTGPPGAAADAFSRFPARFRVPGADGPRPRGGACPLRSELPRTRPGDPESETQTRLSRESVARSKVRSRFAFLRCQKRVRESYVYKIRLKEQLRGYDLLQHLLSVTVVFATTP